MNIHVNSIKIRIWTLNVKLRKVRFKKGRAEIIFYLEIQKLKIYFFLLIFKSFDFKKVIFIKKKKIFLHLYNSVKNELTYWKTNI